MNVITASLACLFVAVIIALLGVRRIRSRSKNERRSMMKDVDRLAKRKD